MYINGLFIVVKKWILFLLIFVLRTDLMLWNCSIYCIMMLLKSFEEIELVGVVAMFDVSQMFFLNCKKKGQLALFSLFFYEEMEKSDIFMLQLVNGIQDSCRDIDLKLVQFLKFEDFDESAHLALSFAGYLVSIGKSMTLPCSDTDNSDRDINKLTELIDKIILQERLMEIFIIIEEICNCSENTIQGICDVLKSGFLEYFLVPF
ncbi:hypothetical protein T552_02308 [Pneumocystis carinii B80]|uniref:Uncharacterized protein n=1 Tax=Pneumocystis carinii (strain B80) TaxID=1408658 RepID=A0A0W4ZG16_PNEC8|nr:hypothetical protein T552_02308 [Pneumocystis carinii B80]KTW27324.1 hypothetical protein T552_02308 [Pneumocystis carinii B80]